VGRNYLSQWEASVIDASGETKILNNVIDGAASGIHLDWNTACPDGPENQCFSATGNVISGNHVTGNALDLSHRRTTTGNIWENNICETKSGAAIPPRTTDHSGTP
jgi:nitrous oxidase accessory protein NosD